MTCKTNSKGGEGMSNNSIISLKRLRISYYLRSLFRQIRLDIQRFRCTYDCPR